MLLANNGILPLATANLTRVAVLGHNAALARTQGGGSATVIPDHVVSPLDGLRAALPDVEVNYALGAVVQEGVAPFAPEEITHPETGEPGLLVRFLDRDGAELYREDRRAASLVYLGGDAPTDEAAAVELTTTWTPGASCPVRLGFAAAGHARIDLDGELHLDGTADAGADPGAAVLSPRSAAAPVTVEAGRPVAVRLLFDRVPGEGSLGYAFGLTIGLAPPDVDPAELLAEAADTASCADLAIIVVGTNSAVESEGHDRTDLALPGHQDTLVRAVAATGTPTVVVVNSGSPVLLPWRADVAAVLVPYFGGQEMGHALADVLLGAREPGGRLPTTWPATMDVPVLDVTPVDDALRYTEGIHVGYRAWLKSGREPAYPFGFGLGYTTWSLDGLRVSPAVSAGGTAEVELTATNTGARAGKQVVQVYLARPDSAVDRPVRWLAGFTTVEAAPGESVPVTVTLPARAFADWQPGGWHYEPSGFTVAVGTSVADLPLWADIELK
ncbi:glycoside hydrolase family 3 C-terminal domain-containing protein [Amycolatopsis sp. FDAARGOS 1241]|uniref:glycoside hydrolase family 3 C-terminal domain-containing protein n=1 Tax=Amycolatopsis sp. FDAARGOS 1241 TaxID=2778070 RepID=UPI0019521C03|nr:glycoside hydrolase family 3 C-terminal domain-containing protein [Amycolatopsis sp. FDAARGOS 1241]QRP44735.1 glycoside hydrolase family 3 C-terminal domain-containing protein [Amycolatopsis sp. FDAARGOS 1241]